MTDEATREDAARIERLGGPAKLADLLGYDKQGGTQRVHNWIGRGIPSAVKVARPELFLVPLKDLRAAQDAPSESAVVALRNHKGQAIGALAYAELVGESCGDTFCVGGDVATCREEDLIVIDRVRLRALAEWAESAAIGPMAIGEEVHE